MRQFLERISVKQPENLYTKTRSRCVVVSALDSLPKGGGKSGTIAYTGICIPLNFRGKNLIGSMACGTSKGGLHVSVEKWSIVIQLFI